MPSPQVRCAISFHSSNTCCASPAPANHSTLSREKKFSRNAASATLKSVFASVDLYDGGGNVVAVGYDGPQIPQAELLARAAKVQERYKLRYDPTQLVAERRVLSRPTGKVMTDDFAPVETMRAIEKNNEKWKEQTEAPR